MNAIIQYYCKNIKTVGAISPVCNSATDFMIKCIQKSYADKKGLIILELGPGIGNITEKLTKSLPESNITCIEIDEHLAEICKNKFQGNSQVKIINDNALFLDQYFDDNTIDVVVTTIPLSFLGSSSSIILKKVANKLIRGGIVISGQIRTKQNGLYKMYIGSLIEKKMFLSIQPIIVTARRKDTNSYFKHCFGSLPSWNLNDKILRVRELLLGIQLKKDLLPRVKILNQYTTPCSYSYLPCESYSEQEILDTIKEYKLLIDVVHGQNTSGIDNDITIKLYQFGQYRYSNVFERSINEIVKYAGEKSVFLRFDTSDREWYKGRNIIDETIVSFEKFANSGNKVNKKLGICLQSYHLRTEKDMEYLADKGYCIRLVKGFYSDGDIGSWKEVTLHYETLIKKHILNGNLNHIALATHDKEMIERLLVYLIDKNIDKNKFSIQGFWGIQDQWYVDLKDKGYNVRIYIPYGSFMKFLIRGMKYMDKKRIIKRILGMSLQ